MGTTSRGLFLQTSSPWLVFLSTEPFRGPLTVNLPRPMEGDPVLGEGGLRLGADLLTWEGTPVWRPPPPPAPRPGAADRLRALGPAPLEVPERLEDLLGRGPGLTPAGDDVILGLLLARARAGRPGDLRLVDEARRRTTTLSANLIALAAEGDGDERLVDLVDYVLAGAGRPPSEFWGWGAHSGGNVLQGVGLALSDL